jgi:integrase
VKPENRVSRFDSAAVAAVRLLMFTGCRLREILHLKWSEVDFERGLLFLGDSKTGKKSIVLNAPALAILQGLPDRGAYVIPGDLPDAPRSDLKRLWSAVTARSDLAGVRIHDLRHTFASYGAGGGLGLPIVGKLLGHTQAATTARYAHLDADPLRRAADTIGATIAAAMDGRKGGSVTPLVDAKKKVSAA